MPSGLTPELASKFMLGLHGGKTNRDMTWVGDDYICSAGRFKKHCELNPEWGEEANRLSRENTSAKKSNYRRSVRRLFCLSGRHRLEGDNVIQGKRATNRFCRACRDERANRPMTVEEIEAVKKAVSIEKRTINNITTGAPIGGGPKQEGNCVRWSADCSI
jgi:hypothetical protein